MATHVLKLQYGADKRSPTRTLDLLTTSGSGPYLRLSGFAPGAGIDNVIWSGQTALRDGQRFVDSTRDNVTLTITYDLSTTSPTELAYHQRQISRFVTDTRLWQRDRIGAPVWLRYRWGEGLSAIGAPTFGQFSYYYKVLYAEVERWPNDLHTGALVANYIESVELTLVCEPYAEGLQQQAFDCDDFPANDTKLKTTLSNSDFNGSFTVSMWHTHTEAVNQILVWEYYVSSTYWIHLLYDNTPNQWKLARRTGGGTSTISNSHSPTGEIHTVVTYDDDNNTIYLYVNGSERFSTSSVTLNYASGGTFTIGDATSADYTDYSSTHDAVRVWPEYFTAAQVLSLYNAEEPIKTAGNDINLPLYLKTRSGEGVFENVDGVISAAAQDNWGVVGNVPGDVPAKVEWRIQPASSERTFWLGRRAAINTFTPDGTLWLDYSGTADSGNSSGDAYETDTTSASGSDTHDFDHTITDPEQARGRFQFLARFKCTGAAIDVEPYFKLGNSELVKGDTVQIATNASFLFRDFGDWVIDWPADTETATLGAGLFCTETAASATTVQLDFVQLLPYPNVMVQNELASPAYAGGDYIVINGVESYAVDDTNGGQRNHFSLQGLPVTVLPEYYNYIFLLQATAGSAYDIGEALGTAAETFTTEDTPTADDANIYRGYSIIGDGSGNWIAGVGHNSTTNAAYIYISTDDGDTWTQDEDLTATEDRVNVVAYGNGYWMAGTWGNGLIYRSSNMTTWTQEDDTSADTPSSTFISGFAYGNNQWLATAGNNYTYKSTDDGDTWTQDVDLGTVDGASLLGQIRFANGTWIIAGLRTTTGAIWRSTDNGATWTRVLDAASETLETLAYGDGVWLAATTGGAANAKVYRSGDDGQNWTNITTITGEATIPTINYKGGVWLLGTGTNGEIWRSIDAGITWTELSTGSVGDEIYSIYGAGEYWCLTGRISSNAVIQRSNQIKAAATVKALVTPRYQLPGGIR